MNWTLMVKKCITSCNKQKVIFIKILLQKHTLQTKYCMFIRKVQVKYSK